MKLCLFGGSFNPVHNGHVYYAEKTLNEVQPDILILMPAWQAPLKDETPLDSKHRLNMINLAFKNRDKILISDWELKQGEISYTINTVKHILSEYDNIRDFIILLGMDQAVDLYRWNRIDEILDLGIQFLIFPRDGFSRNQIKPHIFNACLFLSGPNIPVSSSRIRQMLKKHMDVKQFLPEDVNTYINEHRLYRNV
jgi:nicotinate-nucleotide adenylyltransferase